MRYLHDVTRLIQQVLRSEGVNHACFTEKQAACGDCDMLKISGGSKILSQDFVVSWSSAYSIIVVLKAI